MYLLNFVVTHWQWNKVICSSKNVEAFNVKTKWRHCEYEAILTIMRKLFLTLKIVFLIFKKHKKETENLKRKFFNYIFPGNILKAYGLRKKNVFESCDIK